jgi:predicted transcriptional regulator
VSVTLDLFDQPALCRRTDPPTSSAAAASVQATELEAKVLEALRNSFPKGATTYQLADHLRASLVSISPRMKPLLNKGLVKKSETPRRGDSGRNQIVWVKT